MRAEHLEEEIEALERLVVGFEGGHFEGLEELVLGVQGLLEEAENLAGVEEGAKRVV